MRTESSENVSYEHDVQRLFGQAHLSPDVSCRIQLLLPFAFRPDRQSLFLALVHVINFPMPLHDHES